MAPTQDLAALTLTGRINSVTIDHCAFTNIWSGVNGKATAADGAAFICSYECTFCSACAEAMSADRSAHA